MITVLSFAAQGSLFRFHGPQRWTPLSDFGPAAATEGFGSALTCSNCRSKVRARQTRWVLSVNLNPGGVAGGSGISISSQVRRFDLH